MRAKAEIAAGLGELGFLVFPLLPNQKTPAYDGNWKNIATADPAKIRRLWSGGYKACNIGVRTGLPLGDGYLVVIDVDIKDGKPGKQALKELEELLGELPPTMIFRTASGGEHRYFLSPWPLGSSNSRLGPGIDVRGVGGYVVGCGSVVDGKEYDIIAGATFAHLPEAWAHACGRHRERSAADREIPLVELDQPANIERAISYLIHGAPDHGTYAVACRVRDWGISQEKCLELIAEHWPGAEGKSYDHIETRVTNAYTYGQDPPGIACAEVEFEPVEVSDRRKDHAAPGVWHEPADLWEQERTPVDEVSGMVPEFVERFGRDRARRLGVSPGAMTAATLTTLSSLVPANNVLQMRQNSDSWSVHSIIWTAIVGDPGTAKSPAVSAAMAFPKAIEKIWRGDFASRMKEYERTELAVTSRTPKKRARPIAEASTEQPDFSESVSSERMPAERPKLARKIVNDATTEALALILAESAASAPVLFHSDELAGLIGAMDVYRARGGNKDRPFFLSAKEGEPYAVDRKSNGTLLVPSLAVSIIGTIQDDKLSKIAGNLEEDGFLQRFALVMIQKTGSGDDVPDDGFLDASIPRLATALASLDEASYRLHPDAAHELEQIQIFADRESHRPEISAGLRTWLNKTPNEFGRYCLAFHLIEWATLDAALDILPAPLVSRATAVRARRYIQDFLYSHALHAYGTIMAKGQSDGDVRWVAAYILTRGLKTISAREIGRAYRALRGAEKRQKLLTVMSSLAFQDWVKLTNSQRGEWKVNPAVHDGRFEKIKRSETARRAAVRSEIAVEAEVRRAAKEIRP
ncbi:DUF3987 domain-containing protein [Bradyrhizobium elkanii]|uniref:DUF3987 domain-containing protein n=1 Tax=Bradyrhizobium elkanii TaxID=29448 RepID=A0A4U6S2P8_BRAEL|nr:DUF3987 domain-containing protein [Bradyrhizobium elkanii]TKV78926.1 DUF3987 domain-containing protein [Bradyrhizobium elkanii]